MLQSQKQALRFRRAVFSCLGVLSNVGLCLLADHLGYFVISSSWLWIILATMLAGNVFFAALIKFNANLRFKDASLTLPQMVWVTIWLSVLLVCLRDINHLVVLGYLLVMSFGSFRLSHSGFLGFAFFTVVCYVVATYSIHLWRPNELDLAQEFFSFVGFFCVMCGFAFMGNEFGNLRRRLVERHRELKQAFSRIEDLAITDELTGLHNRRHLMQILSQQRALANRSRYNFVVCYLDLDFFKKVNDHYGHPFGDKVLKAFSDLIKASIREVDIGARMGGEEFVLILADTQLEAAQGVCQRMADKWRQTKFEEAPDMLFTVSVGITEYHSPEAIEHTLERADGLLYDAKHNGRDCIMLDQQDLQVPLDFEAPIETVEVQ